MKRILQLFLAGVFLLSFAAQARVILPKGGEEWSVGSSVQLEWDASGERVTIRLIRPDQEPVVIAEDITDTGHYLWPARMPARSVAQFAMNATARRPHYSTNSSMRTTLYSPTGWSRRARPCPTKSSVSSKTTSSAADSNMAFCGCVARSENA